MFFLFLTGCPTDYSLMGVLQEFNGTGQILHADFDAFKFPTSSVVQFRALVNYSTFSLTEKYWIKWKI
jgi:hypothetical protein